MELFSHLTTPAIVFGLIALTCVRAGFSIAERRLALQGKRLKTAGEVLESFIIAVVVVFLVVRPFMVQAFYIPSESMTPTLVENDRILVSKLSYRMGAPGRHEVVVFRAPKQALSESSDEEEKDFVKRIVGLPGDTIEIHNGKTYVNGKPEPASFCKEPVEYDMAPTVVPEGHYFVMGDNRNHSNDSHRWGTLEQERVIGRAVMVFWPPSRLGLIH
jgi:signal peptidase I